MVLSAIRRTLFIAVLLVGFSTWETQPPVWEGIENQPLFWEGIENQPPVWEDN